MNKPRILVFASGSKTEGGLGFQELVEQSRLYPPILDAEIVGVVSNHEKGGVCKRAAELNVPFKYFPGPFDEKGYQKWVNYFHADYIMCSGWLKFLRGLNPRITVNIHPGPLPEFGGPGFYGHRVHEAIHKAFKDGSITQTAVTMHYVDEVAFDHGPIFFRLDVIIRPNSTPDEIASLVNEKERAWQSFMLNHIVQGHIRLEGEPGKWQVVADQKTTGIIPGFTGRYI